MQSLLTRLLVLHLSHALALQHGLDGVLAGEDHRGRQVRKGREQRGGVRARVLLQDRADRSASAWSIRGSFSCRLSYAEWTGLEGATGKKSARNARTERKGKDRLTP